MNVGPYFQKQKIITQKVSERHQSNFAAFIFIIGGTCVQKTNILGETLYKLEISPIAPLKFCIGTHLRKHTSSPYKKKKKKPAKAHIILSHF